MLYISLSSIKSLWPQWACPATEWWTISRNWSGKNFYLSTSDHFHHFWWNEILKRRYPHLETCRVTWIIVRLEGGIISFWISVFEALPRTGCFTACIVANFLVVGSENVTRFSSVPGTFTGDRIPEAEFQMSLPVRLTLSIHTMINVYSAFAPRQFWTLMRPEFREKTCLELNSFRFFGVKCEILTIYAKPGAQTSYLLLY